MTFKNIRIQYKHEQARVKFFESPGKSYLRIRKVGLIKFSSDTLLLFSLDNYLPKTTGSLVGGSIVTDKKMLVRCKPAVAAGAVTGIRWEEETLLLRCLCTRLKNACG